MSENKIYSMLNFTDATYDTKKKLYARCIL